MRLRKRSVLTDIGTVIGPRYKLAPEHETTLPNFKALAPGSNVYFAASPDIPFPFFERNSYCFEEKKKCESILKSSPEEPISDRNDVSTPPGLWHTTTATHTTQRFCKLICSETESMFQYLEEEKHSKSTFGAKSDTFWHDTSSIKHPLDKTRTKHPFDTTRNHGLDFTTANLLQPNFTIEKYSLPRNKNQHLKLPYLALDRQQPGCRVCSSTLIARMAFSIEATTNLINRLLLKLHFIL